MKKQDGVGSKISIRNMYIDVLHVLDTGAGYDKMKSAVRLVQNVCY